MNPLSTIRRFPVPLACAALGPAIFVVEQIYPLDPLLRWLLVLTLLTGFIAALAAHEFAEARAWRHGKNTVFAALAALSMAPHFLLTNTAPNALVAPTLGFLIPGLALVTLAAPFFANGDGHGGTRRYVQRLAISMGIVAVAAVAVLVANKLLFRLDQAFFIFLQMAGPEGLLKAGIVLAGPALALFTLPETGRRAADTGKTTGRGAFFTGLMQLATVLLLPLLYWKAYLSLTGWDKYGALDFTIPVTGALAVLCHMLAGTTDEGSSGYLRVWRRFYRAAAALPVIAVLPGSLALASSLYDFLAALLAFWVIGAGLHAALFRARPVAVPAAMLGVLLLVAGYGPLNAQNLLDWNRLSLFDRILTRNGILADGRINFARRDLPRREAKILYDLIQVLPVPPLAGQFREYLADRGVTFGKDAWDIDCGTGRYIDSRGVVRPCSPARSQPLVNDVLASLGLWRQTYFEQTVFDLRAGIEFQTGDPEHLDVEGFDYLHRQVGRSTRHNGSQTIPASAPALEMTMSEDGQALIFTQAGGRSVKIDFAPLNNFLAANAGQINVEEFRELAVLDGEAGGLKLRLYPYQIGIKPREDGWALRQVVFVLLIGGTQ